MWNVELIEVKMLTQLVQIINVHNFAAKFRTEMKMKKI
jgi:hypothetical protein